MPITGRMLPTYCRQSHADEAEAALAKRKPEDVFYGAELALLQYAEN